MRKMKLRLPDLSVLRLLPPTHFVNEKACSSQKQQQPHLQTCLNMFSAFSEYT